MVDYTSLDANPDEAPLAAAAAACGGADRTLAAALVTYSRKQGNAAWGHGSLRFLSCRGGALRDDEYEYYRLGPWSRALLRRRGVEWVEDDAYYRSIRGSLFLFRNDGPVDHGFFGLTQSRNREIYELWLEGSETELEALRAASEARFADQEARLSARRPLERRYQPLGANCTWHLRQDLGERAGTRSVLPFAYLRGLADEARLRVLYPSHHAVRRWSGDPPPERTHRLHPVFRRRARLDEVSLAWLRERALPGARPAVMDLLDDVVDPSR